MKLKLITKKKRKFKKMKKIKLKIKKQRLSNKLMKINPFFNLESL